MGDPSGSGGTDFSGFPDSSYFLDLNDIRRAGNSDLLEVPMTVILHRCPRVVDAVQSLLKRSRFGERVDNRLFPPSTWLRPNGRNREALLQILAIARHEGRPYVEFMLHSSELMPGGSPTFPSPRSIESLYDTLQALFTVGRDEFTGQTLGEYYHAQAKNASNAGSTSPSRSE